LLGMRETRPIVWRTLYSTHRNEIAKCYDRIEFYNFFDAQPTVRNDNHPVLIGPHRNLL
jgi:hypothetical protein